MYDLVQHVVSNHSKLDQLLQDKDLLAAKKEQIKKRKEEIRFERETNIPKAKKVPSVQFKPESQTDSEVSDPTIQHVLANMKARRRQRLALRNKEMKKNEGVLKIDDEINKSSQQKTCELDETVCEKIGHSGDKSASGEVLSDEQSIENFENDTDFINYLNNKIDAEKQVEIEPKKNHKRSYIADDDDDWTPESKMPKPKICRKGLGGRKKTEETLVGEVFVEPTHCSLCDKVLDLTQELTETSDHYLQLHKKLCHSDKRSDQDSSENASKTEDFSEELKSQDFSQIDRFIEPRRCPFCSKIYNPKKGIHTRSFDHWLKVHVKNRHPDMYADRNSLESVCR